MNRLNSELQHLKGYAAYLLENLLDEFTRAILENSRKLNLPLLSFFKNLTEDQFYSFAKESTKTFLAHLAEGTIAEKSIEGIHRWKENRIPNIPREGIVARDITLGNNARKHAFYKFLPDYIQDLRHTLDIVKEIEDYFSYNETLAIDAFAEIKQDEIRKSERLLKEAQSFAKIGSWEYNIETREIWWSEEMYHIYELNPNIPIAIDQIYSYLHPDDISNLNQNINAARSGDGHFTNEYRIVQPDGWVKIIYEKGTAAEKNGKSFIRGTAQEITDLRKIEAELKESEKKFRLLAEQSTDVISVNSIQGILSYVSPSVFSVLGYTPEELTGTNAFELYHPEDLEMMQKVFEEVAAIPDKYTAIYRCRKKDGNYIWFESSGKTIRDSLGNPIEIHATNRDITDRKQAEQKIRENEELLYGILNSSLSGLQVFNSIRNEKNEIVDFEWIMANDAIEKFIGLKKETLIGKKLLEVSPGIVSQGIFSTYVETVNGSAKNYRQFYNKENNGHWFNIHAVPFRDGFILSSEDITALVNTKEELKKMNAELEDKVRERTSQLEKQREDLFSIFMQAPVPFAILKDQDLRFELVNDQYLHLLGKKEDIIGLPGREAVPEGVTQGIWDLLENVFMTGFPYYGHEFPILLNKDNERDLTLAYFNFAASPLSDTDGKTSRLMLVAVDVTRQVLARQELKASEEHLKTVLEALPEIAWTADEWGNINYYNSRWVQFAGLDAEWTAVIHPDDLPETQVMWKHSLLTGEIYFRENRFRRDSDRCYRWFLVRAIPVKDYKGRIVMWVGTCTDIHENKLIREQLAAINSELVSKNNELTRINIDLDNFIYTASHDLKAPVSNIEGLVGTLKDIQTGFSEPGEQDRVIDMIEKSIARFKTTIQDLTEISKIQKNYYADVEEINVGEIIEDVLSTVGDSIKVSEAVVITRMENCKTIRFSRINLKSIFYNLISNAIKYRSTERRPEVSISCLQDGDTIIISVKDNGLGIKPEHMPKVFSMFKRFHDHVEGTGVGLYIIKRIVENAGGKIEVFSEEGIGSEFRVLLR